MMGLQRTFIFSLFLHVAFSAVLLLSARFQGDSGAMLNEKIFFIDLAADADKPDSHRSLIIPKDTLLKRTTIKKAREEERILRDFKSDNRETEFTGSLSVDSGDTLDTSESSIRTADNESHEYTGSREDKDRAILNTSDTGALDGGAGVFDDKRDGLTEADALKLISAAIERAKTYPAMARRRGMEGTVYVSFRIGSGGESGEIRVLKSSGYKMLDEATMKVIKKAAPYPYIDDRVEVPVTYRLND